MSRPIQRSDHDPRSDPEAALPVASTGPELGDLKIFWGPEICRLEYLMHLLNTGRVKDEHWPRIA